MNDGSDNCGIESSLIGQDKQRMMKVGLTTSDEVDIRRCPRPGLDRAGKCESLSQPSAV